MRKWDDGFPLSTDPGPIHKAILRVWYRIEDWWRHLEPIDRHSILIMLGGILLCLWLRFLGN